MAAATGCFAASGFAGTSVRDVTAAAGVNPALLRYHFGDKEALWREVVRVGCAAASARHRELVTAAARGQDSGDPIEAALQVLDEHPALARVLLHGLLGDPRQRGWLVGEQLRPWFDASDGYLRGANPGGPSRRGEIVALLCAALSPVLLAGDADAAALARAELRPALRRWCEDHSAAAPPAPVGAWSIAATRRRSLLRRVRHHRPEGLRDD